MYSYTEGQHILPTFEDDEADDADDADDDGDDNDEEDDDEIQFPGQDSPKVRINHGAGNKRNEIVMPQQFHDYVLLQLLHVSPSHPGPSNGCIAGAKTSPAEVHVVFGLFPV